MVAIVNANTWNAEKEEMEWNKDVAFCISQESPDGLPRKQYLQFSKHAGDDGQQFVRPFLDTKLNPGHTIKFRFRLTEMALHIETMDGYRLVTENG